MRVLQVHRDYAPCGGGGGVARHIHGLVRELAARGIDVSVVSREPPQGSDSTHRAYRARLGALFAHVRAADVVHLHGARSIYTAAAALICLISRKPYVYTPHCYYPSPPGAKAFAKFVWDRLVEKAIARCAAHCCALTQDWRAFMESRFAPLRVTVAPNCVRLADLSAPSKAAPLAGAPALLSVGRLDPVKRVDDVVRALARPGLERAVLHIVGRGPDASRIASVAQVCGVSERVVFHGFVDDAGVAAMLQAVSVFVLASSIEGQPTVLMEALLRGRSVAASDIPGNRSVLDPLGLVASFPVGDIDALASCILSASSRPLAMDMAVRVAALFSWETKTDDMLLLYREAHHAA